MNLLGASFIPLSGSLWDDIPDPVFDGGGLAGFKSCAMFFFICHSAGSISVLYCFPILFFLSIFWHCEAGDFGLIEYKSLSPSLAFPISNNNNNINNNNPEIVTNNKNEILT